MTKVRIILAGLSLLASAACAGGASPTAPGAARFDADGDGGGVKGGGGVTVPPDLNPEPGTPDGSEYGPGMGSGN